MFDEQRASVERLSKSPERRSRSRANSLEKKEQMMMTEDVRTSIKKVRATDSHRLQVTTEYEPQSDQFFHSRNGNKKNLGA